MIERKLAVCVLAAALVLGVASDVLFSGRPLGLNVFLFAACFVGSLAVLLRVGRAPLHQGRRWRALPLLLFSAAFVWHDSRLLTTVNLLALGGAVALGGLRRTRHRPQDVAVDAAPPRPPPGHQVAPPVHGAGRVGRGGAVSILAATPR